MDSHSRAEVRKLEAAGETKGTRSHMRRRDVLALGLSSLSLSTLGAPIAAAQGKKYPEQPIRLIVPRAAGGVVDVVARLWAEQVKSVLGTVVIEDQGGAGGTIAAAAVA